jgi:acyl-coenzyme A synthetase/AMP-(fatty) acid ligase/pimeloyl-ACP methyl ester carboxylesterase
VVDAPGGDGGTHTWHLLDNGVADPELTVLCVHGNPSWSYLWRRVLRDAPAGVRVIAPDHLEMGWSERTGTVRRLEQRIEDLGDLTDSLGLDGPVVTVGHDWGGPISLGWAARHREQLRGVALVNTAVHQPDGARAPGLIRLARRSAVTPLLTSHTTAFIRGAWAMSPPRLDAALLDAFLSPYRTRARRHGIRDFVEDIPLNPSHESAAALDEVARSLDSLDSLDGLPALIFWGARDRVFSDVHLHDLEGRLPGAEVHRIPDAGHYSTEHPDFTTTLFSWMTMAPPAPSSAGRRARGPIWRPPAGPLTGPAVVELGGDGHSISFEDLESAVDGTAAGLVAHGVRPGDRVALMVPPGVDLTLALFGCWRLGACAVFIDAGLGPRGMGRAFAAAGPDHLVGIPRALAAARVLGWRSERIPADTITRGTGPLPPPPDDETTAAVVFTSGSTGPSKGVVYRHRQIQAQRDAIGSLYGLTPDDRLVAAFAPFALFGPALGMTTAVPDMDPTEPGSLSAVVLADAVAAVEANVVFASPAALASVVRTASGLSDAHREALAGIRLLLSAGAPVRTSLLAEAAALMPHADAHTPYGMTEMLPVADIGLDELREVGRGDGICVGRPIDGVDVSVEPFGGAHDGGEILVRGPHMRERYDRLAATTRSATAPGGWHRTGDVGTVDTAGRLWVGGRLGHVIWTAEGPVMPVATEFALEDHPAVERAAVVGVGPDGAQVAVAVVVTAASITTTVLDELRTLVDIPLAAVLEVEDLPVDRRHNSKIDRTRIATWAARVLAGGRVGSP